MVHRVNLKWSLTGITGLKSEFSYFYNGYHIIPFFLPIAGGRIVEFIFFPRVFALCDMQTASFSI